MDALDNLALWLSKLPGIGRKTAERMALKIVRDPEGLAVGLVSAIEDARRSVRCCSRCGNITAADSDPCRLCVSPQRDDAMLCVVEEPGDILVIERSGGYRGRYHALMGKISPMKGESPATLRVKELLVRISKEGFKEVILALSTDVEGDATASYLEESLLGTGVKVSRLAYGLPAGSGILYSDPVTLARAIKGRTTSE